MTAVAIIGVIVLAGIVGRINQSTTPGPGSGSQALVPQASGRGGASAPATDLADVGSQWTYAHMEDQMGEGVSHTASVRSTNTVEFDFPYAGAQHATLMLRTHPRYGKEVIFRLERGQILCRSYEDCKILVRFDDGPPESFAAVGPADNSTELVFIRDYPRFAAAMLKAKRVRISIDVFQQGRPVLDFDVRGFEQKKYKPEPAAG